MKVTVTEDDIKNGDRGDSQSCPIARAISRATLSEDVLVVEEFVAVSDRVTRLPSEACQFISRFDWGPRGELRPFVFDLPDLTSDKWEWTCEECGESFRDDEIVDGLCLSCNDEAYGTD